MSGEIHRAISRQLWAGLLSISLAYRHWCSCDRYAAIMPLASHSLLLDITTPVSASLRWVSAGISSTPTIRAAAGSQAKVPTTQMLTGVHFVDAQRGWAVGHDGLILVQ